MDLHGIREDYSKRQLSEEDCAADPLVQFEQWLNEAMTARVNEPTAVNVAAVGTDGRPNSRMVLLKEVNPRGFVFFTNYQSRKGQSLAAHPFAALTFFWPELERQVRVEGRVEKLDAAASDEYFASRPYTSRIGAWASEQSSVIADKSVLVKRAAAGIGAGNGQNARERLVCINHALSLQICLSSRFTGRDVLSTKGRLKACIGCGRAACSADPAKIRRGRG